MQDHPFVDEPDPGQVALRRGRELPAAGDGDGAEELFAEAVELGAADTPWRVTQAYLDASDARPALWMRRAAASLNRPDGVTVDPGTLPITTIECEDYEVLGSQLWCVAVTDCDPEQGAAALRATEPGIGQATEDGRVPFGDEIDTAPSYANCTWVDETKLTLTLDAKDQITPMPARVFLTVLVAELERVGAVGARLHTPRAAWPRD